MVGSAAPCPRAFAQANAENTAEVYEQRVHERRNSVVQGELERTAAEMGRAASHRAPSSPKGGAATELHHR
eukprot:1483795-Prymnesium_polylepis.2